MSRFGELRYKIYRHRQLKILPISDINFRLY
jgi:hypothetical protein